MGITYKKGKSVVLKTLFQDASSVKPVRCQPLLLAVTLKKKNAVFNYTWSVWVRFIINKLMIQTGARPTSALMACHHQPWSPYSTSQIPPRLPASRRKMPCCKKHKSRFCHLAESAWRPLVGSPRISLVLRSRHPVISGPGRRPLTVTSQLMSTLAYFYSVPCPGTYFCAHVYRGFSRVNLKR